MTACGYSWRGLGLGSQVSQILDGHDLLPTDFALRTSPARCNQTSWKDDGDKTSFRDVSEVEKVPEQKSHSVFL